ncbi:AraC family transcriptional regulator [uncultured Psychroserpens sp.]|uniref:helix-turn-helix domain-containing protein n=1 Tax=uncultured Psychroserpens sp. TaxID=255436 RepID=UPI00260E4827|nr:AraC family transcriptional regulator [uncultured Psychroserpens sp.]
MIFETHILENPLAKYIETIFYFKNFTPDHSVERVVPTGHLFIIFELDGFERHTYDNETLKLNGSFKHVWVSGMHKNFLSISAHQNSEMLVVQFKPIGAYPFFHFPVHEINDKVIDAQQLFGSDIKQLRDHILKCKDISGKFEAVTQWLNGKYQSSNTPNDALIDVMLQLQTKSISEGSTIVSSYPKSQKHLINQFKTYFGLTPKVFHRVFRFNEILKQIQNKTHLNWSQIAYEFEYSDQSHFIKEFKEFSGFNPQEFIKSNYHKSEPNFFPLDKKG